MIDPHLKIIVIDNEKPHLDALVKGLTSAGLPCMPYHFAGDFPDGNLVSGCRVIFCDLHLGEIPGGAGGVPELAAIASFLMESISDEHGPYLLVLWSQDAEWMGHMEGYIETLDAHQRPVRCVHLDKHDHINLATGEVKDLDALKTALSDALEPVPAIRTLLELESAMNSASAQTVSQIYKLAGPDTLKVEDHAEGVSKLLGSLAEAASGKTHAANDPWAAVVEALTPLIGDRLRRASVASRSDEYWKQAIDVEAHKRGTSNKSAAAINSMLNLDFHVGNLNSSSRGAVCVPPSSWSVASRFGLKIAELYKLLGVLKPSELTDPKWRLVQIDAACDSAQSKPGVIPYVLALELPRTFANNSKKASSKTPEALWLSPWFEKDDEVVQIRAHPRLIQGFSPSFACRHLTIEFRIRDQLLEDLVFAARTYAARPGYVSVRR